MKKVILSAIAALSLVSFTASQALAQCVCQVHCLLACCLYVCPLPAGWVPVSCDIWPGTKQVIVATGRDQTGTCYIFSVANGPTALPDLRQYGLDNKIVAVRTGYQAQFTSYADLSYTGTSDHVTQSTGKNLNVGNGVTSLTASVQ